MAKKKKVAKKVKRAERAFEGTIASGDPCTGPSEQDRKNLDARNSRNPTFHESQRETCAKLCKP